VNIASRLEGLNKEFGSALVVSDATVRASGLVLHGAETREIAIRGREEMLTVHVVGESFTAEDKREIAAAG
jgi:adenylate cyclase